MTRSRALIFDCFGVLVDARGKRNQPLIDTIAAWRERYKIGVLSNTGRGTFERYFSATEGSRLFDAVVLSAETGYMKPDPEIYELAAERLDTPPEACLFIDDQPDYCLAAERVGMASLVFISGDEFEAALRTQLS